MPRCTVHRRHTLVSLCVRLLVHRFFRSRIFVSNELQVLKVGQHASSQHASGITNVIPSSHTSLSDI